LSETIQGESKTFRYGYDLAGRLEKVWRNDTLISTYVYDSTGNRLVKIAPTTSDSGTYDVQDRLLTYSNTSYSYTRNGELQFKIEGSDTTKYTYDSFGNLITVLLPDGNKIDYIIDGQNRRIGKKISDAIVARWIYEGQLRPVAEVDSAGNIIARYVYGMKPNVPDYVVKSGIIYRIVTDHLGSVRLIVNTSSGAVAQRIEYDEFGNILYDSSPNFSPFAFAGGLYDTQTKLVRFGQRDYDAISGRWTNKDPILFKGGDVNLYGYVANDPINSIDPEGKEAFLAFDMIVQSMLLLAQYDVIGALTYATSALSVSGSGSGIIGGAVAGAAVSIARQMVGNLLNDKNLTDINWWSVGQGAFLGAFFAASGPKGPLFGRGRYTGGGSGFFNTGNTRVGWFWQKGRNWFGPHGGVPRTDSHWHIRLIPGPKGPLW
jgi:RHS repeat-associated protein